MAMESRAISTLKPQDHQEELILVKIEDSSFLGARNVNRMGVPSLAKNCFASNSGSFAIMKHLGPERLWEDSRNSAISG